MQGRRVFLSLAVFFLATCGLANAATIIDDFSQGGFSVAVYSNSTTGTVQQPVANVLGGMRYGSVAVPAGGIQIEGLDNVQLSSFPTAGILNYESSVGAEGTAGLRYYDDDQFIGDLSGALSIQIDFSLVDLGLGGPMDVTVSLEDGSDNNATLLQTITTAMPQSLVFPFAAFSGIGGLNLADLHEVDILFDPGQAADFRITQIIADVPEPTALALLALGALSSVLRRRAR